MGIDFTVFKGSQSGEIVETKGHREVGPTQALVKVSHCGVCFTDEHYRHVDQGLGHEGTGVIVELGSAAEQVSELRVGDRVGMGWMQKFCGYCKPCLTGQQVKCANSEQFGSANLDVGCFSTAIVWDVSALFKIPDGYPPEAVGPLMCGGATVWGPLYEHNLKPGSRIGILGIGGLGHLAIQFAAKAGFEAVVFSSSESKKDEALRFGASEFHATKGVSKFQGMEPLDALLITASELPDLSIYIPILAPFAKIFPLTIAFEAILVPALPLVIGGYQVIGSAGAHPQSIKEMLRFAARHEIKPTIETYPMTKQGVEEALSKLREGRVRYRGVLEV